MPEVGSVGTRGSPAQPERITGTLVTIRAERTAPNGSSALSVFEGVNPNGEWQPRPLLEQGHHARQNFIQQIGRQCFDFVAMPCCQIEHAWLIAADNTRRSRA